MNAPLDPRPLARFSLALTILVLIAEVSPAQGTSASAVLDTQLAVFPDSQFSAMACTPQGHWLFSAEGG